MGPFVVVLGVAQDGGHPQAGCRRECCRAAWERPERGHAVSALGIVDPASGLRWLVDATPDLPRQLRRLDAVAHAADSPGLAGVLLTHAHVGHYAGLLHLGREVMGAREVPVWAMPRMRDFLSAQAPWEMLVRLGNVRLQPLEEGQELALSDRVAVTPVRVPHRDEYSETVGFVVRGPSRRVLYLPDIDKWQRWDTPLEEALAGVDRAYLDATFHSGDELPGRDMAEIPHPFVVETAERLRAASPELRARVRLIHMNHTNPLLDPDSAASRDVAARGLAVAVEGEVFAL